jgi:hypothetical protein
MLEMVLKNGKMLGPFLSDDLMKKKKKELRDNFSKESLEDNEFLKSNEKEFSKILMNSIPTDSQQL